MLGDGRLVRSKSASYYTESHCGDQKAYLEWKAAFWAGWDSRIDPVPDKRGYSQFRLRTCAHDSLNSWHAKFYPSGKGWKSLSPDLIKQVDAFALAIWYLDDGHAGWWPSITFGMNEASRLEAIRIFRKFDLEPRWVRVSGKTGVFHMEREATAERFLDLIRPHVPDCMSCKVEGFGFQGVGHQIRQRVTREVLEDGVHQGVPISQMARELGVGATTISRRLRKWKIPLLTEGKKQQPPPVQWLESPFPQISNRIKMGSGDVDLMLTMAEGGFPAKDIAEAFGFSVSTVRKRLKEKGFRGKPGPKKDFRSLAASTAWLQEQYPDTSHWSGLSPTEQEAHVQRILSVLRNTPFPFEPWSGDANVVFDKLKQHKNLNRSPVGLNLCRAFFPHRYKARYKGGISSFEGWFDDKHLRRAVRFQLKFGHPVVPTRVLKALVANCRTPTIFKPAVAKYIYDNFCPSGGKTWDPCSGYGGRLLGAAASGVRYIGTDVIPETIEGNRNLAEVIGYTSYQLEKCPAEKFDCPPVDLVFTSPPYFTQEIYSEKGEQSSILHGESFENWLKQFLHPLIRQAKASLLPEGKLALNVADVRQRTRLFPLVEKTKQLAAEEGFLLVRTVEMPISNLNKRKEGEPILIFQIG